MASVPSSSESLVADPEDAAPSSVPGLSKGELRAADADIRWFSRLTFEEEVLAWRRARQRASAALERVRPLRAKQAGAGGGDAA
ncbi:MAG: hypothetical protein IT385_08545 [Deltaproteobacteria bacterium]|nr:hypothetical protein [Deltaproteobacteria bacterium]